MIILQAHDFSSGACTVDKVDAYIYQLLTHKAFVPCDRKLQAFAIQDIRVLSNEINLKVNIAPLPPNTDISDGYCFSLTVIILLNAMDGVSIPVT